MDDVEQFSRALSAIAQAGAYSAKDIRQICAQEVQYVEETMNPIADDHGLRKLIRDWDSILRDPERERIANI